MSAAHTEIIVEGDYIDSFLYWGTLFLVHSSAEITTHPWDELIDESARRSWGKSTGQSTINYLKDCRNTASELKSDKAIHIDQRILNEKTRSKIQLKGWPTDINIYSNNLYIANENGVDELRFDSDLKRIDESSRLSIYNKYSYKISPNDGHRIAIAAGQNGVVAAYPRKGIIKEKEDLKTLVEADSHDCEWIGPNLAVNTLNKAYFLKFPALPKRPEGELPDGYWEKYNLAKKAPPQSKIFNISSEKKIPYIWVAGSNRYKLYEDGEFQVEEDSSQTNSESVRKTHINNFPISGKQKIIAARTALFGTIVEIGEKLISVGENSIHQVSNRPVSWRIFPRAKNYGNQLHIIENDFLKILAHHPNKSENKSKFFEISADEVI